MMNFTQGAQDRRAAHREDMKKVDNEILENNR